MFRFYCTKCEKIKRTRQVPRIINSPLAEIPLDRIGECNWHITGRVIRARKSFVRPVKSQSPSISTSKSNRKQRKAS